MSLLDRRSSVNEPAKNGITPLHLACEHGHYAVVGSVICKHGHYAVVGSVVCKHGHYTVVGSVVCKHGHYVVYVLWSVSTDVMLFMFCGL